MKKNLRTPLGIATLVGLSLSMAPAGAFALEAAPIDTSTAIGAYWQQHQDELGAALEAQECFANGACEQVFEKGLVTQGAWGGVQALLGTSGVAFTQAGGTEKFGNLEGQPWKHSYCGTSVTTHAPSLDGQVRWAQVRDRTSLLKASVAMFLEEVGYDPMSRDAAGYTRRVDELTRQGRTVVAVNSVGAVMFKVDLGLAHADHCQLQGVWLHPAYRGSGFAVPLFARACQLIRQRYPHLSLYVNDYNAVARALYQKTGWVQQQTFATVLF